MMEICLSTLLYYSRHILSKHFHKVLYICGISDNNIIGGSVQRHTVGQCVR
nr:MAG TPA: DNA damage repair protein [Caudoviricetes sp.]